MNKNSNGSNKNINQTNTPMQRPLASNSPNKLGGKAGHLGQSTTRRLPVSKPRKDIPVNTSNNSIRDLNARQDYNVNMQSTSNEMQLNQLDKMYASSMQKQRAGKKKKIAVVTTLAVAAATTAVVPIVIFSNKKDKVYEIVVQSEAQNFESYSVTLTRGATISHLIDKLNIFEGHILVGVYKDNECTIPYSNTEKVKKDTTVWLRFEKERYSVNLPTSPYYTIEYSTSIDNTQVEWGSSFVFRVNLNNEYANSNIIVRANGSQLTKTNEGWYIIDFVGGDVNVTVEGLQLKKYTINSIPANVKVYDINNNEVLAGGQVTHGDQIRVVYTEDTGWQKSQFQINGVDYENGALIEVLSDVNIIYTQEMINYSITLPSHEGYAILYNATDLTKFTIEDTFTFSIKMSTGYDQCIDDILVSVTNASIRKESNQYVVSNITGNVIISVSNVELNEYTVTFKSGNTIVETQTITHGEMATMPTTNPTKDSDNIYDYRFTGWDNDLTTPITGVTTFNATFEPVYREYTLSYELQTGCKSITITRNGIQINSQTILHYGDVIEISTEAGDGYNTVGITVQNAYKISEGVYEVRGHVNIIAQGLALNEYLLTLPSVSGMYMVQRIDGSSDVVAHGSSATIKLVLDASCSQSLPNVVVKANGTQLEHIGNNQYLIENITSNVDVTVESVELNTYTITKPTSIVGYTLEVSSEQVKHGQSLTITFKLLDDYSKSNPVISINGNEIELDGNGQYTKSYVTQDIAISVDDVELNTYSITVSSGDGYSVELYSDDEKLTDNKVVCGQNLTFKIILDEGYDQSYPRAIINGGEPISLGNDLSYTINSVADDLAIAIISVELNTYNIVVEESEQYTILWQDSDTVKHGLATYFSVELAEAYTKSQPIVTAENAEIELDEYDESNNTYRYRLYNADNHVAIAIDEMQKNKYDVVFLNYDGTELSRQSITHGEMAEIPTNPTKPSTNKYKYVFAGWNNDVAQTIIQDCSFTAQFDEELIDYSISFATQTGITISVTKDGETLTTSSKVNYDDIINIDYDVDGDYEVSNFVVTGATKQEDGSYKITGDVLITYDIAYVGVQLTLVVNGVSETYDVSKQEKIVDEILTKTPYTKDDIFGIYVDENYTTELGGDATISEPTTIYLLCVTWDKLQFVEGSLSCEVYAKDTSIEGYVVLPQAYNDKPVKYVRDTGFFNCNQITKVFIPEGFTVLEDNAFYNCKNLNYVSIPNSLTSIGAMVFSATSVAFTEYSNGKYLGNNVNPYVLLYTSISSITTINIHPNTMLIASYMAQNEELLSVHIPSSVKYIGTRAFANNLKLTSVTFDEGSKLLSIGEETFAQCKLLNNIKLPNKLESIGEESFAYCSALTNIEIPSTVTNIGSKAFRYCEGLQTLSVQSGNSVYDSRNNCNAIIETATNTLLYGAKNSTIPNTITGIEEYAFYQTAIPEVVIPGSVLTIGQYSFGSCSNLSNITISQGVTTIKGFAFSNTAISSLNIPASVTSIAGGTISGCNNLTSIKVVTDNSYYASPEGSNAIISKVGTSLISGCKTTIIPNTITEISMYAFYDISELTSITIPSSVNYISQYAFCGSGLTSVFIPQSVTSIQNQAFRECANLTSIIIEDGNTVYDSRDNCNAIIETETNKLITGCKSTTIPSTVITIGEFAFTGCDGLTEISIPNSVTRIEDHAFYGCNGLTHVTIPSSVTMLSGSAFAGVGWKIMFTFEDTNNWYNARSAYDWERKQNGALVDITKFGYVTSTFTYLYKLD